ncbi:MAG: hypothetical protein U0175_27675 [Caldilineaceae bacterium]
MPNSPSTSANSLLAVLATAQSYLANQKFIAASSLLAEHIEDLLTYLDWQHVDELLPLFPAEQVDSDPDLRYVMGWVYARSERIATAINLLERAKYSYRTLHHDERVARCCLELARIYQLREKFTKAASSLREEAYPLFAHNRIQDRRLQARFWLRLAELSPDINQSATGKEDAERALAIYRELGDPDGEFKTLTRLASFAHARGDLGEAEDKLALAKSCWEVGNLGASAEARLLNLECHSAWYGGDLAGALVVAEKLQQLADSRNFGNQRVYARMLLGNGYRDSGRFYHAFQCYSEARTIVDEIGYVDYHPWIDTQMAWCHLVAGDLTSARYFAHASLKTSDLGQAMSFQVVLAVVDLLENQLESAQRLLRESLDFYAGSQEEFAVCSLHLYLAWIAYKQKVSTQANEHLDKALRWLEQRRLDYLPFWWHPILFSDLCGYALLQQRYEHLCERIFIHHLKDAGIKVLQDLCLVEDERVRNRAHSILSTIYYRDFHELESFPDSQCKYVVEKLLQDGFLLQQGFIRLVQELTTATHFPKPNLTLVAVFGLYLVGNERAEIAEKVGCGEALVRNYINHIYSQFGLAVNQFASRRERKRQLHELARHKGFVK